MPEMPKTFRHPHLPEPTDSRKRYDRERGTARQRGYTSKWDKASAAFLKRHTICPACEAAGILQRSEVTDHIVPHKRDQKLFWERKNWQPCCRWHHDVVKQKLERMYFAGQIPQSDLVLTSRFALSLAANLRP